LDKVVYLFGDKQKTEENFRKNAKIPEDQEIPQHENKPADKMEPDMQLVDTASSQDEEAFLYHIGSDKESGRINATWDEVAAAMNELFRPGQRPESESTWRKRYTKLRDAVRNNEIAPPDEGYEFSGLIKFFRENEKQRQQIRDERMAYSRQIRSESRQDMILNLFRETITSYPPQENTRKPKDLSDNKAIYAMLSDIHYGQNFDSFVGRYDSDIAAERVMRYGDEIVLAGKKEKAGVCFVSLMGDMISGNIHQNIRVENKENVIQQIVGVSELVSRFLLYLAYHFDKVIVNSVDGNHSRIDPNLENVLRGEKTDALVPWYCKAKLAGQNNIVFIDNEFDSTIASFRIGKKLFIAVHGDMEKDLKTTAVIVEKAIGQHIDYLLAGHLHVPEMRTEDTTYIRNGSVCGSGDDFTIKHRLFSPPCQVFMVLGEDGSVRSINTVNLSVVGNMDKVGSENIG
jgi:hypothetical protein